jgi:two-component system OmpR family response regulator
VVNILVVEDDPVMGALIQRGLSDEGYDVTLLTNGVAALISIAGSTFSAAAIDVMLPEMSGFEICRQLRRQGSTLPILLITARDAIEDRVLGLDYGADDYLTKPFAFAEFSARIRALVRRDAAALKPTLSLGRLEIDSMNSRVTAAGKVVSLSSKEFTLLKMFALRAGDSLTRDEILQEVWGTTRHIDPTIVDQYVSYLRRKLDHEETGIAIVTIRNVGYQLRERR